MGGFDIEQRKIYHARLMDARPFINSLDFARNGRESSGKVPVAELPRLRDMLEDPQGILSYTIRGGVDKLASHFLDISVTGQCRLRCQRCLDGMDYPVRLDTRLLLCDQTALDALDDDVAGGEEEYDSILADEHQDVTSLLEEELLLSMPIAPSHDACQATGSEKGQEEKRHPFAILANLKHS